MNKRMVWREVPLSKQVLRASFATECISGPCDTACMEKESKYILFYKEYYGATNYYPKKQPPQVAVYLLKGDCREHSVDAMDQLVTNWLHSKGTPFPKVPYDGKDAYLYNGESLYKLIDALVLKGWQFVDPRELNPFIMNDHGHG